MGLLSNQDDVYKEGIYVICLTSVENLEPVGMQYVVKLDKIAVDNGLFSFLSFFFLLSAPLSPFPPLTPKQNKLFSDIKVCFARHSLQQLLYQI